MKKKGNKRRSGSGDGSHFVRVSPAPPPPKKKKTNKKQNKKKQSRDKLCYPGCARKKNRSHPALNGLDTEKR